MSALGFRGGGLWPRFKNAIVDFEENMELGGKTETSAITDLSDWRLEDVVKAVNPQHHIGGVMSPAGKDALHRLLGEGPEREAVSVARRLKLRLAALDRNRDCRRWVLS